MCFSGIGYLKLWGVIMDYKFVLKNLLSLPILMGLDMWQVVQSIPQRNGQIERMVQTTKNLLKNAEDLHLAVLSYRATPHPWCKLSPAELSMGRQIRTMVPVTDDHLIPTWSYLPRFQKINSQFKDKQKKDFDSYHGVHSLPPISNDTDVWINLDDGRQMPGKVVSTAQSPRSYVVHTSSGQLRSYAIPAAQDDGQSCESQPTRMMTRTQTGTEIKPPARYS